MISPIAHDVIGHASSHRWGDPQRSMNAAEVVVM
jgi:hypothetical protein